ncbi:hypothetical protein [Kordia jejudonensis]|nr:hypothetical protein [Kordia jejudonensis]
MKRRKSKLDLSKKMISVLQGTEVKGGKKPKSQHVSCDSLLEQTFTNC